MTVCTRMGRRQAAESKGCVVQSKVEAIQRRIRSEVPRDESQVSVGVVLALGYGRKWRTRKKR
jgi:hypothetical protein